MLRFVFHVALLLFTSTAMAAAAELDGVVMPDKQDVAGYHLVLNGLGLRTYSILRVHIYVAGLYLERRTIDPNAILSSSQPKLLRFLESGEISPLGESSPLTVNVRVIAATNSHLEDAVRDRVLKLLLRAGIVEHVSRGDWRIVDPLFEVNLLRLDPLS